MKCLRQLLSNLVLKEMRHLTVNNLVIIRTVGKFYFISSLLCQCLTKQFNFKFLILLILCQLVGQDIPYCFCFWLPQCPVYIYFIPCSTIYYNFSVHIYGLLTKLSRLKNRFYGCSLYLTPSTSLRSIFTKQLFLLPNALPVTHQRK